MDQVRSPTLGPLETNVMEVLWLRGQGNVHDVAEELERTLAYTTVMTTLDRLYKKGLLHRRKQKRSYLYWPRMSREEWGSRRTQNFLAGLYRREDEPRQLFLSCFLDLIVETDAAILDELEAKIQQRRIELMAHDRTDSAGLVKQEGAAPNQLKLS